jgi:hypothetical protein
MALIEQPSPVPAVIPVVKIKSTGEVSNEVAFQIVQKDVRAAEDFVTTKQWTMRWKEIDYLYQSPRSYSLWEGSQTSEANVQSFLVARHTQSIVPSVMNTIFFQDPFFFLRTTPSSTQEICRQKTVIYSSFFREIEFEKTCWDGWFYTVLFGTGIFKWAECYETKTTVRYRRKAKPSTVRGKFASIKLETKDSKQFDAIETTTEHWKPEFFHIPNDEVLVDPSLEVNDIRKAKFVGHIKFMTGYDLIEMCEEHRGETGWTVPSETEIRSWFETPAEPAQGLSAPESNIVQSQELVHAQARNLPVGGDPLMQVLKVIEHWTKKRKTVVVNGKLVVCNQKNPYGKIPFYSSHWWKIPKSFWSMGIGMLTGQNQLVDKGSRNAALNMLSMLVNPPMLRKATLNQPGQNIRLRRGGMLTVEDDVEKAFKILEMPKIPSELWTVLGNNEAAAEDDSGADLRNVQGSTRGPGGTSQGRTATGASFLASANANRIQGPVSIFVQNVLLPWFYDMDGLINEAMSEDQMKECLGEELGKAYADAFDAEPYLNGKTKFEVLATQHLAAKRSMSQILPMLSATLENQQLLANLHQAGKTVDVIELVSMFCELSEFTNRYSLIRDLNQKELEFMSQQAQQAGQAAAGKSIAIDNNKARNTSDINYEQNDSKAVEIALRHSLEKAIEPMLQNGEPGGQYAAGQG